VRPHVVKEVLWRHFLTCLRNAWEYCNRTYHSYLLVTQVYLKWWHFQDHRFKGQRHRQQFLKLQFSGW